MLPTTGTDRPGSLGPTELDNAACRYAERARRLPADDADRTRLRRELIETALPFATRLARRYQGRGEPLEDLEQVAGLGLLHSVDRYDPERGPFSAFASVTILGELRRHFRDRTWGVHVPRRMQELSREVSQTSAELTGELHRRPTTAEVAGRLRISTAEVHNAQETAVSYATASLNAPRAADTDLELIDELGSTDAQLDLVEDRLTVSALLCRLPVRERRMLAMRFYGNRTQSEIAAELGISQMHVSRLLTRALTWLRGALLSDAPHRWPTAGALLDAPPLAVRTRPLPGPGLLVEPTGEVDRDTAGQLREALLAAVRQPVQEVRLHLAGVPFIDAAGIAALLSGMEAARSAGRTLRITGTQPYVRRALRTAGLGPRLER